MAEKFMQDVRSEMKRKGTEGALTRQAARRGMSPSELCRSSHSGKMGHRCAFLHATQSVRRKKKRGKRRD